MGVGVVPLLENAWQWSVEANILTPAVDWLVVLLSGSLAASLPWVLVTTRQSLKYQNKTVIAHHNLLLVLFDQLAAGKEHHKLHSSKRKRRELRTLVVIWLVTLTASVSACRSATGARVTTAFFVLHSPNMKSHINAK